MITYTIFYYRNTLSLQTIFFLKSTNPKPALDRKLQTPKNY
jgi:hypothetical protein